MDFDDLDEEIESRLEAGEEVAGAVRENRQPRQGTSLPLANRDHRVATHWKLPEAARRKLPPLNGQPEAQRRPVLRLLCVHGVADSYAQEWQNFVESAPLDVDVLVHEFPGHGHREGEPMLNTLDAFADDAFEAFREAMDTGAFALLGHSIGCLIVTAVARRARKELAVEPVIAFMVERGAPQYRILTDAGWDMILNDPEQLMGIWNPLVVEMYRKGGDLGKRTFQAWTQGLQVENEGAREVGWHLYRCPLVAIYGEETVGPWLDLDRVERDDLRDFLRRKKVIHRNFQFQEGGRTFTGHFPLLTYEAWDKWTEHSIFRLVECASCDHMSIKASDRFKTAVWEALREQIEMF